jgi:hypothetical protein
MHARHKGVADALLNTSASLRLCGEMSLFLFEYNAFVLCETAPGVVLSGRMR